MGGPTKQQLAELWLDAGHWRAGIYRCAEDPRVVVPRRIPWTGYSLNFAHGSAIPVLIGILATVGAPFLLLAVVEYPASLIWVSAAFTAAVAILTLACHWESTRAR